MDLRTKFVFALVAVSLGNMLALGFVGYTRARDLLREQAREKLEGVAESKRDDLENVKQAWQDRVRLIASRTQLRLSLQAYARSHGIAEHDRIAQILGDAGESVPTVRSLTVYDADGHAVTTTARDTTRIRYTDLDPALLPAGDDDVAMTGLAVGPDGILEATFLSRLMLDGESVGAIAVVMRADDLIDVTSDHTGLGETGETMVAYRVNEDSAVIINPVRHAPGPPLGRRVALDVRNPVAYALAPRTARPLIGIDYRGEEVLSATRYLPEFGWALIVKVDADEQEFGVLALRTDMIRLGLSIGAFAVLIGTLLGLRFARPIRHLADVANRIHAGETDARATLIPDDEIGILARTFNQMAEKLIENNPDLATGTRDEETTRVSAASGGRDGT